MTIYQALILIKESFTRYGNELKLNNYYIFYYSVDNTHQTTQIEFQLGEYHFKPTFPNELLICIVETNQIKNLFMNIFTNMIEGVLEKCKE